LREKPDFDAKRTTTGIAFHDSSSQTPSIATWSVAWTGAPAPSSSKIQLQLMDSNEDSQHLASAPSSASAISDLYEVFSTPYTKEDVARGVFKFRKTVL